MHIQSALKFQRKESALILYIECDASFVLTRIFPRLASNWPRPYFSVTSSPFPAPFLPSDHPTFSWLRIFTILRVEKFAFFQAPSQRERERLRTKCVRHFLLFFQHKFLCKITRHFDGIAINVNIELSLQELVILMYIKKRFVPCYKYL